MATIKTNLSKLAVFLQSIDNAIKNREYQEILDKCDDALHKLSDPAKRSLIFACRAKVHLAIGEGASHIRAINDLIECEKIDGGIERADHLYTAHIENIYADVFSKMGKSGVLATINCIPRKEDVKYILEQSLFRRSYFGGEFWRPRGLRDCSKDRGTLQLISDQLKKFDVLDAKQWQQRGDSHLFSHQPDLAMQAYTFSLHQASGKEEKMMGHIGMGNAFFAKNWRVDADKEYKEAINCGQRYVIPYLSRMLLLSTSSKLGDIKEAIHLSLLIMKNQNGMHDLDDYKERFSSCLKSMFARHGKKKVFAAIKLLNSDEQFMLLNRIVEDKQHFIGQFFWKNRIPFTKCSREKGTLKEIDLYMQSLQWGGDDVGLCQRDSVASLGLSSSLWPSTSTFR